MSDDTVACSFCAKVREEVFKLIAGKPGVFICNECISVCIEVLDEYRVEDKPDPIPEGEFHLHSPAELKAQLDEYVIGQDKAKRILSVAVYNHYKKIKYQDQSSVELEKSKKTNLTPDLKLISSNFLESSAASTTVSVESSSIILFKSAMLDPMN